MDILRKPPAGAGAKPLSGIRIRSQASSVEARRPGVNHQDWGVPSRAGPARLANLGADVPGPDAGPAPGSAVPTERRRRSPSKGQEAQILRGLRPEPRGAVVRGGIGQHHELLAEVIGDGSRRRCRPRSSGAVAAGRRSPRRVAAAWRVRRRSWPAGAGPAVPRARRSGRPER